MLYELNSSNTWGPSQSFSRPPSWSLVVPLCISHSLSLRGDHALTIRIFHHLKFPLQVLWMTLCGFEKSTFFFHNLLQSSLAFLSMVTMKKTWEKQDDEKALLSSPQSLKFRLRHKYQDERLWGTVHLLWHFTTTLWHPSSPFWGYQQQHLERAAPAPAIRE